MLYKICLVFIVFVSDVFAQNDSLQNVVYPVKVDSITIIGNEITEPEIILRELTFKTGDIVTEENLEYNKDRIYSLGIFTRVDLLINIEDNLNKLIIYVEESWYIYPIPFAELKDKDWDKISYGINLIIKNLRGRNETLRGRAAFGFDPSFHIEYYNPLLIPAENIFFGINLFYIDSQNKSHIAEVLYGKTFEQKFINGSITLGKRFGLFHRLALFATYNYIETPFYIKGISASNQRIDRMPSIGLQYSYDTRDLAQFPREGFLGIMKAEAKGLGVNNIKYMIYSLDLREYRKIYESLGSKWRIASRTASGGDVPYYDYSFLGFNERIRGHYQDESEGNSYYLASAELNYPLVSDFNISLDFIPIIPHELLSYRVALYFQIFADAGTTRLKGQKLSIGNFQSGYGAGFTFLVLPYNLARLEIAFDEYKNMEWIFDLGISF